MLPIYPERLFEKGEFEGAAPQESPFHQRIVGEKMPFSDSF
jgi:hypothetical protein